MERRPQTIREFTLKTQYADKVCAYLDENPKIAQAFIDARDHSLADERFNASVLGEFVIAFRQFVCPDSEDKLFTEAMAFVLNKLIFGSYV